MPTLRMEAIRPSMLAKVLRSFSGSGMICSIGRVSILPLVGGAWGLSIKFFQKDMVGEVLVDNRTWVRRMVVLPGFEIWQLLGKCSLQVRQASGWTI